MHPMFNAKSIKIGESEILHLINIKEITPKLKKFLDKSIGEICEGDNASDIKIVKKRLIKFLETKKDSETEKGAVAEFFAHLFLRKYGFKQEFLFLNLEEESIKKGFDGYYSSENEEWIFESKSGSINTKGINHEKKIKEGYKDLQNKIAGKTKNNPWQNAYSHASMIDVKSASSLRASLKKLSEDFTNKKFYKIKNFNIIPSSTIFLEGKWKDVPAQTKTTILELINKFEYKKIHILCVHKNSLELFREYLIS